MMVGLRREYFRCITCGADLEQHVNGCISVAKTEKTTLQSVVDGYFGDGSKAKFGLVTAPRQRPRKRKYIKKAQINTKKGWENYRR